MQDYAGRQAMNALFGDQVVAQRSPDILCLFQYNVAAADCTQALTGTGAATVANATLTLSTGASTGSAAVTSRHFLRYQPGFDGYAYFTAAFTDGTAGYTSEIGLGVGTDNGYFIRYTDGLLYAVRRYGGSEETKLLDDLTDRFPSINFSNLNIFRVSYGWLGVAPITFEIFTGLGTGWERLHFFQILSKQTTPSNYQPAMRLAASVSRTSGSGAVTLKTASWSAGRIGSSGSLPSDQPGAYVATKTVTTEAAVFTLKAATTFQGVNSAVMVRLDLVAITGAGNKPVTLYVKRNATLGGSPSYTNYSSNDSVVSIDTAGTTVTGGVTELVLTAAANASDRVSAASFDILMFPGEALTFSTASSVSNDSTVSIRWREMF